jgi:arylsulfatase A-like enzyme
VYESAVSNLDVFATVLDFIGLDDADRRQSQSLQPILAGDEETRARIGYAESVTQRAVFQGDRYIRMDRRPASDERFWRSKNPNTGAPHVPLRGARTTPLSSDPKREEPVGSDDAWLLSQLKTFSREADRVRSAIASARRDRALSEQDRERLRALGYLE